MQWLAILGFIVAVPLTLALYWYLSATRREARRRRLRAAPLSPERVAILERRVHLYRRLPRDLKSELRGHVNVLLAEKTFVGCNGLEIDDDIRVTIAGYACLLLLGREPTYFPGFTSILVYPDTFIAPDVSYDGDIEIEEHSERAGESWYRGPLILSWSDVLDSTHADEGFNVVLHEFAHKLDEEDSGTDGLPILHDEHYEEWADVLSREFAALEHRVMDGANDVLDEYGLSSPAEFFAVATESFFEEPTALKAQLPDLYEQLQRYYRVDPAAWL